jgi:hypothetical protein
MSVLPFVLSASDFPYDMPVGDICIDLAPSGSWEILDIGESALRNLPIPIQLSSLRDGVSRQMVDCPPDTF